MSVYTKGQPSQGTSKPSLPFHITAMRKHPILGRRLCVRSSLHLPPSQTQRTSCPGPRAAVVPGRRAGHWSGRGGGAGGGAAVAAPAARVPAPPGCGDPSLPGSARGWMAGGQSRAPQAASAPQIVHGSFHRWSRPGAGSAALGWTHPCSHSAALTVQGVQAR